MAKTIDDARISVGFLDHPKTGKVMRRIGAEGVLCLLRLILWTVANEPNGDLAGNDEESLEIIAKWTGEPGGFVAAIKGLYLDGESGSYSIHDWQEHQPYAATRDVRHAKAVHAATVRHGKKKDAVSTTVASSEDATSMPRARVSNAPYRTVPNHKNPSAAKPAAVADSRFDSTKKFIERCCEHAKVPFLWGPGEAKQLSDWLKQAPGVDIEGVQQLVRNRYRSNEPAGKRPREWIPHLSSYAVGPVDRFGKDTVQAEDKLPNVNELRAQQRKQAALVGG